MTVSANIPVIDISGGNKDEIARQLVDAAEEHGFIYIRNLGLDIAAADIDRAFKIVNDPYATVLTKQTRR